MNRTWKWIGLLILTASWIGSTKVQAQTVWTLPASGTAGSGSTAVDFEFRTDGSIVEKGMGTSTLSNADLQSSSRFIWYPSLSALRVGSGASTETLAYVGQGSVALGGGLIAMGAYAIALGEGNTALGQNSLALGDDCYTSGGYTTAIGHGCSATVGESTAIGYNAEALNSYSMALGAGATASGPNSMAFGYGATANGLNSVAFGNNTLAQGNYATVAGYETSTNSYNSFVIGQYNRGLNEGGLIPNAASWVPADPLFEVGSGASSSAKADALVIYKDGNATLQGKFSAHAGARCAPGGDLSMGSFTAGTAP